MNAFAIAERRMNIRCDDIARYNVLSRVTFVPSTVAPAIKPPFVSTNALI